MFNIFSVHVISLIVAGLAVVAVFVYIPFVSDYAFWFLVAAYVMLAGHRWANGSKALRKPHAQEPLTIEPGVEDQHLPIKTEHRRTVPLVFVPRLRSIIEHRSQYRYWT
jgi:hypothetical protein